MQCNLRKSGIFRLAFERELKIFQTPEPLHVLTKGILSFELGMRQKSLQFIHKCITTIFLLKFTKDWK